MAILWYNLKEINETNLLQSKWSSSKIILIVLRFLSPWYQRAYLP